MKLMASLAPARVEVEAGVVAKADQQFVWGGDDKQIVKERKNKKKERKKWKEI